jgi:hypothetical protein
LKPVGVLVVDWKLQGGKLRVAHEIQRATEKKSSFTASSGPVRSGPVRFEVVSAGPKL